MTTWTPSPTGQQSRRGMRTICGPARPAAVSWTLRNGEAQADDLGFRTEPPDGIEPSTYALRVGCPDLVQRWFLTPGIASLSAVVRSGLLGWLLAWLLGQIQLLQWSA
ncbi:hypothetical protein [Micromonospora sediminicola]|uniref:hypothetical protein n=1 Tax=Micromonospora sediminicola TaxID=946078 RepID=UPI0011466E7E|nr:hypothetical protein [Micromonospora sediminicola]